MDGWHVEWDSGDNNWQFLVLRCSVSSIYNPSVVVHKPSFFSLTLFWTLYSSAIGRWWLKFQGEYMGIIPSNMHHIFKSYYFRSDALTQVNQPALQVNGTTIGNKRIAIAKAVCATRLRLSLQPRYTYFALSLPQRPRSNPAQSLSETLPPKCFNVCRICCYIVSNSTTTLQFGALAVSPSTRHPNPMTIESYL